MADLLRQHIEGSLGLAEGKDEDAAVIGELLSALEFQLSHALDAEDEVLWWARTKETRRRLMMYFIQTLPNRLKTFYLNPGAPIFPHSPTTPAPSSQSAIQRMLEVINLNNMLRLAYEECSAHQAELEQVRDARARAVGELYLLLSTSPTSASLNATLSTTHHSTAAGDELTSTTAHRRPSPLTLLWPRILVSSLIIYSSYSLVSSTYAHRHLLAQWFGEAQEAVKGLVEGYIVEPVLDVWDTVRASGLDTDARSGGLVSKEGVLADTESLERMCLSLAKDVLHYGPEQLEGLRAQVQQGDLTPIMQIYEADIRSPLKGLVAGSLVRGILVQVQKEKVDIDQALSGIDRLLKSQELTFAFVGVAPALVILYAVSQAGYAVSRYTYLAAKATVNRVGKCISTTTTFIVRMLGMRAEGAIGSGSVEEVVATLFGLDHPACPSPRTGANLSRAGKVTRKQAWADLRRVERVLIRGGASSRRSGNEEFAPLATGLMLLSLTRLRAYADTLPSTSSFLAHRVGLRTSFIHSRSTSGSLTPISPVSLDSSASSSSRRSWQESEKLNSGSLAALNMDPRASLLADLSDLFDPRLDRLDKTAVVQRIWRGF